MKIILSKDSLRLADIDPFAAELLRRLPDCANMDAEAAERRLYSSPTAGADPEADEEWKETVEPELRELFQSHAETVALDIATMSVSGRRGHESITIPRTHIEAWMHTLNQARIALAAVHEMTEAQINGDVRVNDPGQLLALVQVDFYGHILGLFLQEAEE